LFYDLQSELIDLTFHYTETLDGILLDTAGVSGVWGGGVVWAAMGGILVAHLDVLTSLVQLLVGAFKLGLALFLF
jgi:hypothetical protein